MSRSNSEYALGKKKESPAERNKHGKRFEKDLTEEFHPLERLYPIVWERVIDTAAAGNVIRKADCDFKLTAAGKFDVPGAGPVCNHETVMGMPWLFWVEVKASSVNESLSQCFRDTIDSDQLARMKVGARAGVVPVYLFHSLVNGLVEVWNAQPIMESYYTPRAPIAGSPRLTIAHSNLKLLAVAMASDPRHFVEDVLGIKYKRLPS